MISGFAAVKAYENYVRELRRALVQAYEQNVAIGPLLSTKPKRPFVALGCPD